jgi:heterodisulfide reductase subunit C
MEGALEPSKELAEMLERCLLCGYCQSRCALKNMDIITAMRQSMAIEGFASKAHRENAEKILSEGRLFDSKVLAKREGRPDLSWVSYRSRPKELSAVFSVLERLGIIL